jgi:hypothetical protein
MEYILVYECLHTKDGILYYTAPKVNGKTGPDRICLPLSLQPLAFKACHEGPAGHFGITKTGQIMRERFYFPHQQAVLEAYINNCIACITKKPTKMNYNHLMYRAQLSHFNQRVYTDLVGPLTATTYNGEVCKYICTIMDGFTRYLVAIPIPDATAATVAKAIVEKWIYVHSCPLTIHSDRGSCYTSELFTGVMNQLGITKTVTPAYTPESDRIERAHRILGDLLRADRTHDATSWAVKLPVAVFAYNNTVNRMTGVSPFQAIFGRAPKLPVDWIFPTGAKEDDRQRMPEYLADIKLKFQRLMEAMVQHQKSAIALDQSKCSTSERANFQEGQIVYYFMARLKPGISKKLYSRWSGPWRIRRKVSDSLVVIFPEGSWAENPREVATVINRLKKVDPTWAPSASNPSRRYRIDLEAVLDQDDEQGEIIPHASHQLQDEGEDGLETTPRGAPPITRDIIPFPSPEVMDAPPEMQPVRRSHNLQ